MKRRNKITFQGETVLIRVTLYTCTAVTFSTLCKVLHPTTLFILATIKFWVHKARSSRLLTGIFISPYIYAVVMQKTNLNTLNWLTAHPTITVPGNAHHTLIHNLYDKGILHGCLILLYFRIHEQRGGQSPLLPFHNTVESGTASIWSWKKSRCIKKWKVNQVFLYAYFCSLINFPHLERMPDYMEGDLSHLITSPADESCWATACAEACQALY